MSQYEDIKSPLQLAEVIGTRLHGWTNFIFVREALSRGLRITKNEKTRLFWVSNGKGKKYSFRNGYSNWNPLLSHRVANNKDVCSRLLSAYNVLATENAVFGMHDAERAWAWGKGFKELVVKPADAGQGTDVFVGIDNEADFLDAFHTVAKKHNNRVLVEKFQRGVEHRFLMVQGKFIAAAYRRPASVLGNGVHTVQELVTVKNKSRKPIHKPVLLEETALKKLASQGLTIDSVPANDQRVFLQSASNLSLGGDAVDATDTVSEDEIRIAEAACKALPGGNLLGLDILLPRRPGDDEACILEINTKPGISIHYYPLEGKSRDTVTPILDGMFPETKKGQ